MADKAVQETKRRKRRALAAAANKITVILETDVRKHLVAQARAEGMDITPFLVKVLESHVIAGAVEGDPLAGRLLAKRAVLDRAVSMARSAAESGDFDEHFILRVMKKASQDDEFKSLYEIAVGGGERPARSARAALNQQMARQIKRAAGARSKRDERGKIMRAQVQDEIITSYTLLDRAA
ncbi:MAG: hypothetical protein ACK5MY_11030 [Jhaorihella sp.]